MGVSWQRLALHECVTTRHKTNVNPSGLGSRGGAGIQAECSSTLVHEERETTQMYLQASFEMHEHALAKSAPMDVPRGTLLPGESAVGVRGRLGICRVPLRREAPDPPISAADSA